MFLYEPNIKSIVGPSLKEVKDSIKETFRDNEHNGPKHRYIDEQLGLYDKDRQIVKEQEYKALNLATQRGKQLNLLPLI